MNPQNLLQENFNQQKKYVELIIKGEEMTTAAYKCFGNETGDEIVKMKQGEIIIKSNNQ